MSNGWFLYKTAPWDGLRTIEAVGSLVNQHEDAAHPSRVLLPKVSDAYTSAATNGSGTLSLRFTSDYDIEYDTLTIPGAHLVGRALERTFDGNTYEYLESLIQKPTGTVNLRVGGSTVNPIKPNDSKDLFFQQEAHLGAGPLFGFEHVIYSWRMFGALTFAEGMGRVFQVDIAVNVPGGFGWRIVVPRVAMGVRFTPTRNFVDRWRVGLNDPVRLGSGRGADSNAPRKNPFRTTRLTYENMAKSDREAFFEMFSQSGKTIPLTALPIPEDLSTISLSRMLDTEISYDLQDETQEVDYSTIPIILEEVSRG